MIDSKHFETWKRDKTRIDKVRNFKFFGNVALIEVYRSPTDEASSEIDMIVAQNDDGTYVRESTRLEVIIEPLAKILKVGTAVSDAYADIKEGDVVTVPDDIKNTMDNPEFLNILRNSGSNLEPKIPKNMPKKVAIVNQVWDKFQYKIDKTAEWDSLDTVTYLVPLGISTIQSRPS